MCVRIQGTQGSEKATCGIGSLFPPRGFKELNSDHWTWLQVSLPLNYLSTPMTNLHILSLFEEHAGLRIGPTLRVKDVLPLPIKKIHGNHRASVCFSKSENTFSYWICRCQSEGTLSKKKRCLFKNRFEVQRTKLHPAHFTKEAQNCPQIMFPLGHTLPDNPLSHSNLQYYFSKIISNIKQFYNNVVSTILTYIILNQFKGNSGAGKTTQQLKTGGILAEDSRTHVRWLTTV